MKSQISYRIVLTCLLCILTNTQSNAQFRPLSLTTYPFVDIPEDTTDYKSRVKKFGEELPDQLQKYLLKNIRKRNMSIEFIDLSKTAEIEHLIRYSKANDLIAPTIKLMPEEPSAFIFIKLDYWKVEKLEISAKIISVSNYKVLAQRSDIKIDIANIDGQKVDRLSELASKLIEDLQITWFNIKKNNLHLYSNPDSAEVFINGRLQGTTPLQKQFSTGTTVNIRFKKQKFQEVSQSFILYGDSMINVKLKPLENGTGSDTLGPLEPLVYQSPSLIQAVVAPGLGHIRSGRKYGYLFSLATIVSSSYYGYTVKKHNNNVRQLKNANAEFESFRTIGSAREVNKQLDDVSNSDQGVKKALYILGGVYAISLIDVLRLKLFNRSPHTTHSSKVNFQITYQNSSSLVGVKLNW